MGQHFPNLAKQTVLANQPQANDPIHSPEINLVDDNVTHGSILGHGSEVWIGGDSTACFLVFPPVGPRAFVSSIGESWE